MYRCIILILCVLLVFGENNPSHESGNVVMLKLNTFKDFINQNGVHAVYFFKTDKNTIAPQRQKSFMEQYKKTSRIISVYNVQFGLMSCESDYEEVYCNKPNAGAEVIIFKDGSEFLNLDLYNMFDVDSIMSNVLQIVLLREVPIIQSIEERMAEETKSHGQRDIIFTYQEAIGTKAHRVIMEVAYAYSSQYRFAVTTEKLTVRDMQDYDESDKQAVWVLRCQDAKAGEGCTSHKYHDEFELTALARFLRVIDLELIHDVATEGMYNPYEKNDLHTLYMFCDSQSEADVVDTATLIQEKFLGIVGMLIINTDKVDGYQFGFPKDGKLPTMALLKRDARGDFIWMNLENPDPMEFVKSHLLGGSDSGLAPQAGEPPQWTEGNRDGEQEEQEENVETEDDQVANAVFALRKTPLDSTHITALTDSTFPRLTAESDLLMVNFYYRADARSMAFLRHYVEASHHLAKASSSSGTSSQVPLATMECFDWTDVCASNNITAYPTLLVFRRGHQPRTYTGMLGASAVTSYIQMLQMAAAPEVVTSVDEASDFLAGKRPAGVTTYTNVSVLALMDDAKTDMGAFKEAADILHGQFVLGVATGEVAKNVASKHKVRRPSVIVVKRNDPNEPMVTHQGEMTATDITRFIQEAALPLVPELSPANLPSYLRQSRPLAVLFSHRTASHLHTMMGRFAAKDSRVRYATMTVSLRQDNVNMKVMEMYNPKLTLPALVVIDHSKAAGWLYAGSIEEEEMGVQKWITDILEGKVDPTTKMNERQWTPKNPGYDFLKKIEEQEQEQERNKRLRGEERARMEESVDDSDMTDRTMTSGDDFTHDIMSADTEPSTVEFDETREELIKMRSSRLFNKAHKPHAAEGHKPGQGQGEMGQGQKDMSDGDNVKPNDGHTEL